MALSNILFGAYIGILVKWDLEEMEEEIKTENIKRFKCNDMIFIILLVVPLLLYLNFIVIIICLVLYDITMYYTKAIEKQKKIYDIQTYKDKCK